MDSEDFRRARVYAAWILLVAAAVEVVIGAWTLSGLPGGPAAGSQFGPATGTPFWLRGEEAVPNLLQFTVTALPLAAVLLVALAGRPVGAARPVTLTALTIQTEALVLGLVAWVATLGKTGRWTSPGRSKSRGGRADPDQCRPSVAWRGPADTARGGRRRAVMPPHRTGCP